MRNFKTRLAMLALATVVCGAAHADLLTDPNDGRTWQGAGVGTFANLIHGSDTLATRQQVIDDMLLDDGLFDPTGYTAATLLPGTFVGAVGTSLDTTGTGSFDYTIDGAGINSYGDAIDNQWIQTSGNVGETVWDLGGPCSFAAIFPTIDHGPLPEEAIEATVYLSNTPDDINSWVQASFVRVWLEGFHSNLGVHWDGFTYVVTTPDNDLFRYASLTWGGPGGLWSDGDNEINGVLGLQSVPEPGTVAAFAAGLGALALRRRRKA